MSSYHHSGDRVIFPCGCYIQGKLVSLGDHVIYRFDWWDTLMLVRCEKHRYQMSREMQINALRYRYSRKNPT